VTVRCGPEGASCLWCGGEVRAGRGEMVWWGGEVLAGGGEQVWCGGEVRAGVASWCGVVGVGRRVECGRVYLVRVRLGVDSAGWGVHRVRVRIKTA
jgi:hypothetical protein